MGQDNTHCSIKPNNLETVVIHTASEEETNINELKDEKDADEEEEEDADEEEEKDADEEEEKENTTYQDQKNKEENQDKKNKEENQEEAGEEHWYEIINQRLYDEYEFILDVLPHEFKKFYISRIDELLDQADG